MPVSPSCWDPPRCGRWSRRDSQADRSSWQRPSRRTVLAGCGAKLHRDAAARELRHLDSRPTRRTPGGGIGALSNREHEVAQLVATGLTNRQIAQHLFLSQKTVETHITQILTKLDITSRLAVAAILPTPAGSSRATNDRRSDD